MVPVPYLAVRRYEELLDLREGSLTSPVDTVNRYLAPQVATRSTLARPSVTLDAEYHERLATTIDKVHTGSVVSGGEWDELTHFLSVTPTAVMPRPGTWNELADRLLAEVIIADGVPWMQRFESLNRLLSHPVGQAAAVAACASLGADRGNQIFIDPVCALDGSALPDAGRAVLRQLASPTNDRAFFGALLACIRKTRYGHFPESEAHRLAGILRGVLIDSGADQETRVLAAHALRNLSRHPGSAAAINGHARAGLSAVSRVDACADTGTARRVASRVHAECCLEAAGDGDSTDDVLPGLIHEMLVNPLPDIRLYAAMLLKASPYDHAVAGALVRELSRPDTVRNLGLAYELLGSLRVVGSDAHTSAAQALIGRPDVPAPVRELAAFWVGHMHANPADPFWESATRFYTRRWAETGEDTSARILTNLVYSLGISGNDPLLRHIRDTRTPPAARHAATWWLNIPNAIRESACL